LLTESDDRRRVVFFLFLILFRLQRNKYADAKDIFFFFFFFLSFVRSFVRSFARSRPKRERGGEKEKKRRKNVALTRLSDAYLTYAHSRVCMLLKEFRPGTRSLLIRLFAFFFLFFFLFSFYIFS
jgi:hypothetical protein